MKRAKGATLAEIMAAASWQAHTVRGFVSILGSKGCEKIESSERATSRGSRTGAPEPLPDVDPTMAKAFQNELSRLRGAGATIRSSDIAGTLARLAEANLTVVQYEGARFHKERYKQYGDRLADLADLVRNGLQIPANRYDEAGGISTTARHNSRSYSSEHL